MTRMLLVAEGKTDYGCKTYEKKTGRQADCDGVLQVFIKKCTNDPKLAITCASKKDLKNVTMVRRRLSADDIKRERIAAYAKKNNYDCIAYHMDVDRCDFDERYEQIDDLLSSARNRNIKCIPIAPMKMLESWLLADDNSFPSRPTNPKLPKKPERIWGKKTNPNSNFPKNYLKRVLEQFNMEPSRETFVELAENASIGVLRQKCPTSFQRFYDDLQNL